VNCRADELGEVMQTLDPRGLYLYLTGVNSGNRDWPLSNPWRSGRQRNTASGKRIFLVQIKVHFHQ